MNDLLTQIQNNLAFLAVCVLVIAALAGIAVVADHFLPEKRRITAARRVAIVAICSAIAVVLHILDFPLVFLAPDFYKVDFSEIPVLLCGFFLGPTASVTCEAIKILLKLLFKSTSTAFVGDFANFFVGCSLVLPATILYRARNTRAGAILGLVVGTAVMTVVGSTFNAVYLLPKFAELYGMPLDVIVSLGTKINPAITNVSSFALLAVAPLNLVKGSAVSILTMLLYKRVARPLFGLSEK